MAKKRATPEQSIQWKLDPKQAAYINDLMDEGGFGTQPATVVQSVFWEGIHSLISRGLITRRAGPIKPEDIK